MHSVYRLKENRDFRRVFSRGRSLATSRFVLYWYANRQGTFRVGFSISKKVGNAVVRNRLKRKLRACFHLLSPKLQEQPYDFIVICRKGSSDASFERVQTDIAKLLHKAKFMV